jgi:hypothetical protein
MSDTKFEKVDARTYRESLEDGKFIKMKKEFENLSLVLTDMRVSLNLSISQPATLMLDANINLEEEYSEDLKWHITGTGNLGEDRIGLIKQDGSITDWSNSFEQVDVSLRSVSDIPNWGSLIYIGGEHLKYQDRNEPFLALSLFVPESQFEKLCHQIVSGYPSGVRICFDVDVFQWEGERFMRGLAGPPFPPVECYIEENSAENKAYLSEIEVFRKIVDSKTSQNSQDVKAEKQSLNDSLSALTETLRVINQRLKGIWGVAILIAIILFLILLK